MDRKTYFSTVDLALTSVLCVLWIFLNWLLAPLSFALLGNPILHDFSVFFTLLLVVWVTGRFGTSLLAGIVGSIIVVFLPGSPPAIIMFCFAISAVVFDLLMSANHHKIRISIYSLAIAAVATILSAFVAGVLIGILSTSSGLEVALTFWGGWHVVGGIFALAIPLPVIMALEKANVRKIKGDRD